MNDPEKMIDFDIELPTKLLEKANALGIDLSEFARVSLEKEITRLVAEKAATNTTK